MTRESVNGMKRDPALNLSFWKQIESRVTFDASPRVVYIQSSRFLSTYVCLCVSSFAFLFLLVTTEESPKMAELSHT